MSNIPTAEWDETSPSGTENISMGAARIRELKTQLREVFDVDHEILSSGGGDVWGRHNKVSFKTDSSSKDSAENTLVLFSKDVSGKAELHYIDEDDNELQLTSGGSFIGGFANEVRIWKGLLSAIPQGWALCDGSSGRPNLIGQFIRGINTDVTEPGTTGGEDGKVLLEANLPSHNHTVTLANESVHTHSHNYFEITSGISNDILTPRTAVLTTYTNSWQGTTGAVSAHTHTANCANTGSGTALNNRPAYYEVAYIIKT